MCVFGVCGLEQVLRTFHFATNVVGNLINHLHIIFVLDAVAGFVTDQITASNVHLIDISVRFERRLWSVQF